MLVYLIDIRGRAKLLTLTLFLPSMAFYDNGGLMWLMKGKVSRLLHVRIFPYM